MPVLINFKICDNAKECGGLGVCSTGALSWDDKKKKIIIDNSKCVSCGKCENECPTGAIKVAKNEKEYKKLEQEIEKDSRKKNDLFTDRYGAQPINTEFLRKQKSFDINSLDKEKISVIELFNQDSIKCLLSSIPIKDLFKNQDIKYRKVELEDNELLKKYQVKQLPTLLFFNKGKTVGKIEGHFYVEDKEKLIKEIKEILK